MNITLPTFTPTWPAYVVSQRKAFDFVIENALCHFFDHAFSYPSVQEAILNNVNCRSRIGRALNDHINDHMNTGIESEIESGIEQYMRNFEIDADAVKNLPESVECIISDSSDIVKNLVEAVMNEIAEKLSR